MPRIDLPSGKPRHPRRPNGTERETRTDMVPPACQEEYDALVAAQVNLEQWDLTLLQANAARNAAEQLYQQVLSSRNTAKDQRDQAQVVYEACVGGS